MLLCNPLVSDNKMASDVVNKLQIGKRNGQWPTAAVRRNCSEYENVAWTTKQQEGGLFSLQTLSFTRNKWLRFDVRNFYERDFVAFCAIDNNVYYFYMTQVEGQEINGHVIAYGLVEKELKPIKLSLTLKYAKFFATVVDELIYILPNNGTVMCSLNPSSEVLSFPEKQKVMSINRELAYGIVQGLRDFWKCDDLQDFTVTLGTTKFGCHRFLLAACSGYFKALFRSGMKETEIRNVDIDDISSETFELILETLYTGHGVLTNDNVIDIWRAADKLQIVFLITECEHYVIRSMSSENYIEYYQIGNLLSSQPVTKAASLYVLNNFNSFVKTSAFLELSRNDLLKLVQSQNLKVNSEHDVIMAILKWTEFRPTGPQDNLSNIRELRCKRLKALNINDKGGNTGDIAKKF
uniref:BTB domain-containing protein n=1 Tax=Biomphalaria glabrata TaxID=6526 RepID=A0A2C9LKC5_BIOGL